MIFANRRFYFFCVLLLFSETFFQDASSALYAQSYGGRNALTGRNANRPAPMKDVPAVPGVRSSPNDSETPQHRKTPPVQIRLDEFHPDFLHSKPGEQVQVGFGKNRSTTPNPLEVRSEDGKNWSPATEPHPSVARIIGFEDHSVNTSGSGTYLGEWENYGLVLTNDHVIADAKGLVQVHFPNRNAYYAAVVSKDSDWDLALLMLSKPKGIPSVKVTETPPRINDPLWIAGYGRGRYRLAGGHCLMYVVLSDKEKKKSLPAEFLDVSTFARDGDSGGPIFNAKGELAGVLCASNEETTVGSYSGRVRKFLHQSYEKMQRLPEDPLMLFAQVEPKNPRHTLNEGAKIFQAQKETAKNDPVTNTRFIARSPGSTVQDGPSTLPYYPGARRGSGSNLASRLLHNPAPKREARVVQDNAAPYYPAFPSFELPAERLFAEERYAVARRNYLSRIASAKTQAAANLKSVPDAAARKEQIPSTTARGTELAANFQGANVHSSHDSTTFMKPDARSSQAVSVSKAKSPSQYANASPERSGSGAQIAKEEFTIPPPSRVRPPVSEVAIPIASIPEPAAPVKSTPNEPYAKSYSSEVEAELIPIHEELVPAAAPKSSPGSVLGTMKILALIAVGFFVLFNLVKLMTIIEENNVELSE